MNDFSIPDGTTSSIPSPMNSVHSEKRPTSSMSPMILTDRDGDVKMVVGGIGGRRIIPAVAQVRFVITFKNFLLIYLMCMLSKAS